MKRRVVITGMGAITPYGLGCDLLWQNVLKGKSCIRKLKNLSLEGQVVQIGGEVDGVDEMLDDSKDTKRLDRYIKFALLSAKEAVESSNVLDSIKDPYRFGVLMGSGVGGFGTFETQHKNILAKGPTKCSPFTIPMIIANMATGKISIKYGAKGVNKTVISACATSNHCIGDAFRTIQYNDADVIIAGGAEAVVTCIGVGAFSSLRALSKRNDEPEKASRPYDIDRDGFVMSEGSGALVLEELEHAKARGAKIYAEIVGYGQTADAYDIVAPDPEAKASEKCMELALKDAGLKPEDIDYINTHGTSTGLGDKAESLAIARLFGDKEKNKNLKVSSTKSAHGHLLGATSAVEAIISIKAMNEGKIPPTINLDNQDPKVANLDYVPNKMIEKEVKYALSNSFGFGGHNTSVIFKKFEE